MTVHLNAFANSAETQKKKQENFIKFREELEKIYYTKVENLSETEKLNLQANQINAKIKIFVGENALVPLKGDVFAYIREYGVNTAAVFNDYDLLVEKFNRHVSRMEALRNALQLVILIFATAFTVLKELKSASSKEKLDLEHI